VCEYTIHQHVFRNDWAMLAMQDPGHALAVACVNECLRGMQGKPVCMHARHAGQGCVLACKAVAGQRLARTHLGPVVQKYVVPEQCKLGTDAHTHHPPTSDHRHLQRDIVPMLHAGRHTVHGVDRHIELHGTSQ
jgi:hypothetical protein